MWQPREKTNWGQAVILRGFGGVDLLEMVDLGSPKPLAAGALRVATRATSINPIEWKMRQGLGLPRAAWSAILGSRPILGLDFSGVVSEVGSEVQAFKPGDAVFGALPLKGAYAAQIAIPQTGAVALKPQRISHEVAALAPFAGLVALACLEGRRPPDRRPARVMVIGASGGVGHLAVQMARRVFEIACVVGVCSAKNAAFVRSCGAHEIVAYDITPPETLAAVRPEWVGGFDLIIDAVGEDRYYRAFASRLLSQSGRYVAAALPAADGRRPGEDVRALDIPALAGRIIRRVAFERYHLVTGLAGDLEGSKNMPRIAAWLEDGRLAPHMSAQFPLTQVGRAHQLSQTGHTVGKISIVIEPPAGVSCSSPPAEADQ